MKGTVPKEGIYDLHIFIKKFLMTKASTFSNIK